MKGWLFLAKQEMTRLWIDWKFVPVTLMKLLPQTILRQKTKEVDWYDASIVWISNASGKTIHMWEFAFDQEFVEKFSNNATFDLSFLNVSDNVKISAYSKWKGFQGVIRRFGFAWWPKTHGSKMHRSIGSTWQRKPRRTKPGYPLAWRMWNEKITSIYTIVDIVNIAWQDFVAIKGSVPGHYGSIAKIFM